MMSGEIHFSNQINEYLEFGGTNKELSIAEILEVEDFATLDEETVSQELSYEPVSNPETLEEEHDDTEEIYEEMAIPKKVNQLEATHEHKSNLGQNKMVHAYLKESYEELEISKNVGRVKKECENTVKNQRCAAISLEEATDGTETREDFVCQQNQAVKTIDGCQQVQLDYELNPNLGQEVSEKNI